LTDGQGRLSVRRYASRRLARRLSEIFTTSEWPTSSVTPAGSSRFAALPHELAVPYIGPPSSWRRVHRGGRCSAWVALGIKPRHPRGGGFIEVHTAAAPRRLCRTEPATAAGTCNGAVERPRARPHSRVRERLLEPVAGPRTPGRDAYAKSAAGHPPRETRFRRRARLRLRRSHDRFDLPVGVQADERNGDISMSRRLQCPGGRRPG
jgi:hypothetical protein